MFPIVESREIAKNVFFQKIQAPRIAKKRKAGQFLIIRKGEGGERIPLTIVDSDPIGGTVTIIYQVVGKSTAELSKMKAGEELQDVVGPLGLATHIENFGTVSVFAAASGRPRCSRSPLRSRMPATSWCPSSGRATRN